MTTPAIRRHMGFLYTVDGSEATIVGCTALGAASLELPAAVGEGADQFRVVAVGEAAFAYMSALQSVTLPGTLRRIGRSAFEATGLTELRLPEACESLQPFAFFGCERLTRVQLPGSAVFTLYEQSLGGCSALKRENVTNQGLQREEDLRRAGLPEAAPFFGMDAPSQPADGLPPVQQLLEKGVALEDENRLAEAAAIYLQAHGQRRLLGAMADVEAQFAALHAISQAEYRLAVLLKFGLVPARNPDGSARPTAAQLLRLVVDTAGFPDAAYHLGDLLAGGYGEPADPREALRLLHMAADAEPPHARACLDLGYACLHGTLAAPDVQAAARCFARCAALDSPYADIAREELAVLPLR